MKTSDNDRDLLAAYAREGSHESFAQLVARYSPMVFNAALRRTRNHALSEDVTQAVFIVLARTAKSIKAKPSIAGWLHQTAIFAASNALRAEARIRRRETEAAKRQINLNPSTMKRTTSPRWLKMNYIACRKRTGKYLFITISKGELCLKLPITWGSRTQQRGNG